MSRKDYIAYLASLRAYVLLAALLFIASFAIGYTASSLDPAFAERWTKELEVLRWIMNLNPLLIMMIIFLKNLLACAMAILLGLGMGVVPLMVATSNGVLLGVVSHNAIKSHGLLFLIAGILPHGIIELPVVLISIAIGIRLGILLIYAIAGAACDLLGEVKKALGFLLFVAAPLLFLAAAIETFITPIAIMLAGSHA